MIWSTRSRSMAMTTTDLEEKVSHVRWRPYITASASVRSVRRRVRPASLFWRVFLVNVTLVTVAVALLALTPLTIARPTTLHQLALLGLGLGVWLLANALLLRIS